MSTWDDKPNDYAHALAEIERLRAAYDKLCKGTPAMRRTIAWFSCGAASAVAAKFVPEAELVYCETGSEHPDNARSL